MARNEGGRATRRKAEWRWKERGRERVGANTVEEGQAEEGGGRGRESETKRWGRGERLARVKSEGGKGRSEGWVVTAAGRYACRATRHDRLCCVCNDTRAATLPLLLSFSSPSCLFSLQPRLSHPSHPCIGRKGGNESCGEKQGVLARRSRGSAILRGSRSSLPISPPFKR